LQIIWEVEIANHSEEDYYFKLMSYIETALLSQAEATYLPPESSTHSVFPLWIDIEGPEISEETIGALLNGNLPHISGVFIGKMENLQ